MMNKFVNDGVGAVSVCKLVNGWLLFFVDGQDETAENIARVLESCSTLLRENNFVVLSTTYHSELHHHFEAIYGTTATNTITFVTGEGAAVLRWAGYGNLEDIIKRVMTLNNHPATETGEFGYPSEVFLRELMLDHQSEEKEVQSVGSDDVPVSVETGNKPPSEKPQSQPSERNETVDTKPATKKPQTQPKEQTVLQIRSPDGLSVTETFKTESRLSEVRDMIAVHFSLTERFGLASSFPRYHYVSQDYNRNLEELNLWPNAVLIIVPPAPGEANETTSLLRYTGYITGWAYSIVTYIWRRIRSAFSFNNRDNSRPATISSVRQRDSQPQPSVSRRQGNIRTLRDADKDDDKRRTTYNGNSTQQL